MSAASYVIAALGLAVLMVVHEAGHYFAARYFGMRVIKFSIGLGPTIVKHQPAGSPTVFQIAIIPFLAYVQIAGMNPYEENDPEDKGSYANASLLGRIVTISAGSAANYVFASVLFFFGFMIGGRTIVDEQSMRVVVAAEGPAKQADIRDGDKILSINGTAVPTWDALKKSISAHPGETIEVVVERKDEKITKSVTTGAVGTKYAGKILIGPEYRVVTVGPKEALGLAVTEPPQIVYGLLKGIAAMITRKEKAEVSGPVGIVRETAAAVQSGAGDTFKLLAAISAYLAGFNLLPFPALDGGRLIFLAFEATARRKPDQKVELGVHAVGLLMLLTLIAVVTVKEVIFH
ncbi:MAG: M50 family metallopeptidase [Polyangiaceae bacterium]